jgi:uncharacterized membrane protein
MWRTVPGLLLGAGLGGFADGIVLHQIAQWHNMGSAVLPPTTLDAVHRNMAWDGWFHAAMLAVTTLGVFLLWRSGRRGDAPVQASILAGQLLMGWGAFNLIEGVVDHHLLELHHVRDLPVHVPEYDVLFLALGGAGLFLIGATLAAVRSRAARLRLVTPGVPPSPATRPPGPTRIR